MGERKEGRKVRGKEKEKEKEKGADGFRFERGGLLRIDWNGALLCFGGGVRKPRARPRPSIGFPGVHGGSKE